MESAFYLVAIERILMIGVSVSRKRKQVADILCGAYLCHLATAYELFFKNNELPQ